MPCQGGGRRLVSRPRVRSSARETLDLGLVSSQWEESYKNRDLRPLAPNRETSRSSGLVFLRGAEGWGWVSFSFGKGVNLQLPQSWPLSHARHLSSVCVPCLPVNTRAFGLIETLHHLGFGRKEKKGERKWRMGMLRSWRRITAQNKELWTWMRRTQLSFSVLPCVSKPLFFSSTEQE